MTLLITIHFLFCCRIHNIIAFVITASKWEASQIAWTTTSSPHTLNIQMASCGNDGHNDIFLFGGKTVSPTPPPTYYDINIYNAETDTLTTEAWDTWQTSPPGSFEIQPHHYTQFNN
eukprot:401658_1